MNNIKFSWLNFRSFPFFPQIIPLYLSKTLIIYRFVGRSASLYTSSLLHEKIYVLHYLSSTDHIHIHTFIWIPMEYFHQISTTVHHYVMGAHYFSFFWGGAQSGVCAHSSLQGQFTRVPLVNLSFIHAVRFQT